MAVYYMESSALVKRYVTETGTAWVRSLVLPAAGNTLFIAQITGIEVVAAIALRARRGTTSPADAAAVAANFRLDFVRGYYAVPLALAIITQAMDLAEKHGLRAYDATQLATALQVQAESRSNGTPEPIFISAGVQLNAAATAEGLAVDNPNSH